MSPVLAGRFLTTGPPGRSPVKFLLREFFARGGSEEYSLGTEDLAENKTNSLKKKKNLH